MNLAEITVKDISEVLTMSYPKGSKWNRVERVHYGLLFAIDGQLTYTHKGKQITTMPGYAYILPKNETYAACSNRYGTFPIIEFECENFFTDEFITLPVKNMSSAMKDFEQLKHLIFKGDRLMAFSLFYSMLHNLEYAEDLNSNPLIPAINYLEANHQSSEITNKLLAAKCNISEVYFRKLFLKNYGISPRQYIIDIRIRKAKQLLTEGTLKISAVAEQCGFSNQYHFCRIFKQKCGITPTEFIRKNKTYKI